MGLTISQKIIAAHCGRKFVEPGEYVMAAVNGVMSSDSSSAQAVREFNMNGFEKVFDSEKIFIVFDHHIPAKDITTANNCAMIRQFVRDHRIKHFYDVGRGGIQHLLAAQEGFVLPGELFVAADSHTCTLGALGAFTTALGRSNVSSVWALGEVWLKVPESIKVVFFGKRDPWVFGKDMALDFISRIGPDGATYCSLEYTGEAISSLPMNDRLSLCNMSIEAGAKNGIVPPDEVTFDWINRLPARPYHLYQSDSDAAYREVYEIDVSKITPRVAKPSSPCNVAGVDEINDVPIDQAFIGSCTNSSLEDLRLAAKVLSGKKIHRNVRLIVIPGTQKIYAAASKEKIIETIIESGGVVGPPTCGPCAGLHMGIIGKYERAISSSNRNFIGRMGDPESEVYLANPAVVAASAVAGKIVHPREIV